MIWCLMLSASDNHNGLGSECDPPGHSGTPPSAFPEVMYRHNPACHVVLVTKFVRIRVYVLEFVRPPFLHDYAAFICW